MKHFFTFALYMVTFSTAHAQIKNEGDMQVALPGVWESTYLDARARSYIVIDNELKLHDCAAVQLEPFICYVRKPGSQLSFKSALLKGGWVVMAGSKLRYQIKQYGKRTRLEGFGIPSSPWVAYAPYRNLEASQIDKLPNYIKLPLLPGLVVCQSENGKIQCLDPHRPGKFLSVR